jgi:hypothetical protein
MLSIIGITIIVVFGLIGIWWVGSGSPRPGPAASVSIACILVGFGLVYQESVVNFTMKGVGSIQEAADYADYEVKRISDIRDKVEEHKSDIKSIGSEIAATRRSAEAQSKAIDSVAREVTAARREATDLAEKNERAERKLEALTDDLGDAADKLSELMTIISFKETIVAARNDDREAFDRLKTWADDSSFEYAEQAEIAWLTILYDHSTLPPVEGGVQLPWAEGAGASDTTLEQCREIYTQIMPSLKPRCIEYIWGRSDFPEKDRIQFLIDVMRDDKSLDAVERAGRYLSAAADLDYKPLAVADFLKWWEENKEKTE